MDDYRVLTDFSINNPDLDKLESIINTFNPLKILRIEESEIRNSNVLAWLIDPDGHHGLGDTLFKNVLLEILRDSKKDELPQIKDVIGADFSDLKVMREWRNIDILAVAPQMKIVVVIENKIKAEESKKQLAKYVAIVKGKYPDYKKVFVLLTLDGTAPRGSDLYIPFTHEQIHSVVQSTVELRKDYMHSKVYDFIQQYLSVLEEKSMKDDELIELCGKLYQDHKAAIEMILEHGKPRLQITHIAEFHTKTKTESVHADPSKGSANVYYTFIPQAWSGIVPQSNIYTQDKYLVFFTWDFSNYDNHKLALSLNVGNFPDPEERAQFIGELTKADKDGILNLKRSSKTNTRVFSKSISLKNESDEDCDMRDYDSVIDKMAEVYGNPEVQGALKVVDEVVQSFKFK